MPPTARRRRPLTRAQLANLAKGNPRVAERVAEGHYDDRVADRGDLEGANGEASGVLEALVVELETEPDLGERLARALEPYLRELTALPDAAGFGGTGSSRDATAAAETSDADHEEMRTPGERDDPAPALTDVLILELESEPDLGERLATALEPYLSEATRDADLVDAELHVAGPQRASFVTGLLGGGHVPPEGPRR